MIALDPEFVGSFAPPSKLTTTVDGKSPADIPFARLPRLERLRVQGKVDETEVADDDDGSGNFDSNTKKQSREEREKRKMRGKGKSLKRFVICRGYFSPLLSDLKVGN
jgi:U3 small nucleolar RNA-associated protein 7